MLLLSRYPISSKLTRPTIFASAAVLTAALSAQSLAAQQAPQSLPAGRYVLEMRDSTARNPFGESFITIAEGGEVLWERDGRPFAMMRWSQRADTFSVEDAEGCPLSPVGDYLVERRPAGGYQLKLISDGCGDRSTSVAMTWLKPVK